MDMIPLFGVSRFSSFLNSFYLTYMNGIMLKRRDANVHLAMCLL